MHSSQSKLVLLSHTESEHTDNRKVISSFIREIWRKKPLAWEQKSWATGSFWFYGCLLHNFFLSLWICRYLHLTFCLSSLQINTLRPVCSAVFTGRCIYSSPLLPGFTPSRGFLDIHNQPHLFCQSWGTAAERRRAAEEIETCLIGKTFISHTSCSGFSTDTQSDHTATLPWHTKRVVCASTFSYHLRTLL